MKRMTVTKRKLKSGLVMYEASYEGVSYSSSIKSGAIQALMHKLVDGKKLKTGTVLEVVDG